MSKARDLASGAPAPAGVTATELGYVDGVTSAIQTQINSKIGQSTAINPTIVDAKGDIIAASASDTVARLAVGANDTVLTADSSTATGLKWATPAAGGMTLLSTTTLSGATTTISSIDQTYTNLFISVSRVTNASGDGQLRIAPNGNTGISTTTQISNNTVDNPQNDYLYLSTSTLENTDINNVFSLVISNYANTTFYKAFSVNGLFYNPSATAIKGVLSSGGIQTNSAITSLVFSNSGGNLSTGTVLIYGVK